MVCPRCGRGGASVYVINSSPARFLWGCVCGQAWSGENGTFIEDVERLIP